MHDDIIRDLEAFLRGDIISPPDDPVDDDVPTGQVSIGKHATLDNAMMSNRIREHLTSLGTEHATPEVHARITQRIVEILTEASNAPNEFRAILATLGFENGEEMFARFEALTMVLASISVSKVANPVRPLTDSVSESAYLNALANGASRLVVGSLSLVYDELTEEGPHV